nr:hypothetical protein [Propionibacterium sp.]
MVDGPLRRVLAAIEDGAGSLAEVERATGLSRDVVAASVDHLLRLGRLEAHRIAAGCPAGGCAACLAGPPRDAPACDAASTGPGLVALTVRRGPTP